MVVPSCTRVMMLQKFPSFYLTYIFFQQNLSSWQFHVVCNSKIPVDFLHFKLLVSYINDPPPLHPTPPNANIRANERNYKFLCRTCLSNLVRWIKFIFIFTFCPCSISNKRNREGILFVLIVWTQNIKKLNKKLFLKLYKNL